MTSSSRPCTRAPLDLAVLYDVNLPTGLTKRMIYPTEVVAVLPAGLHPSPPDLTWTWPTSSLSH